jgi:hypothetical protein
LADLLVLRRGAVPGGLLLLALLVSPVSQRWLTDVSRAFAALPGS